MKACLMRVNYDPRYVHPNTNNNSNNSKSSTVVETLPQKPIDTLQSRMKATRQAYSPERKTHELLQQRAREQLRQTTDELKKRLGDSFGNGSQLTSQARNGDKQMIRAADKQAPRILEKDSTNGIEKQTNGTACNEKTEVVDLHTGNHVHVAWKVMNSQENCIATKSLMSKERPSVSQSAMQQHSARPSFSQRSFNAINSNKTFGNETKPLCRSTTGSFGGQPLTVQRSKTMCASDGRPHLYVDIERQARFEAEKAIREKKIFVVMGPYPSLRAALRRRGWVEKITSAPAVIDGTRHVSCEDNSHQKNAKTGSAYNSVKAREDSTSLSIMSHCVRNCTPTLLFSVKANDVGSKVTKSTQLVNHFGKASTFTTKAGLCHNLRSVPWFKSVDPNTFYPRCYNLGDPDEKESFFEDYRLTACMSFLKHFVAKYGSLEQTTLSASPSLRQKCPATLALSNELKSLMISQTSTTAAIAALSADVDNDTDNDSPLSSRRGSIQHNSVNSGSDDIMSTGGKEVSSDISSSPNSGSGAVEKTMIKSVLKGKRLSIKTIQLAVTRCQKYLMNCEHGDLDMPEETEVMTASQWEQYLVAYHQFINGDIEVDKKAFELLPTCRQLLDALRLLWPQYDLDGYRNVWIFKPGAKSRGRGIQCTNKWTEIIDAIAASDCPLVAQKYIERPLLIYKTKFDIRQWFLVTDWNPLTLWFYGACYLRFCSQEYTLESFHISIHLSNNSVQKYFSSQPTRSEKLPADNMWKSDEFADYLRAEGFGEVWSKKIVPGMKQAILCVLLCTQDQVEHRKTAFELYGADFMLTEDMRPWLIEINSSPSMARTTRPTAELVDRVLEDTVKVVLDRKSDRTCDTGLFELIYRQQPISEPPQPDVNLTVEGKRVKRSTTHVTTLS